MPNNSFLSQGFVNTDVGPEISFNKLCKWLNSLLNAINMQTGMKKKKFRVLFFQINALLTGFKYNMQICVCSGFIAPDWEEKKTGVINITILLKFFS